MPLGERSYAIHIGRGLLVRLGPLLGQSVDHRAALIVTDEVVGPILESITSRSLADAGCYVAIETLPAGEATKCLRWASRLYDRLVDFGADRQSLVVALGGGVIGDLAGFVAATYARGVAFVQIPTTLLAMVDAAVGGKVAIDHPLAKNMIGAFHQPICVVCDLDALASLPEREFRCGLAEVVKYGVSLDAALLEFIEQNAAPIVARSPDAVRHIVAECCRIKAAVVEQDERELTGARAVLNYGHTFAHALETVGGYALRHGEAVAIGMICAGRLAERTGIAAEGLTSRQLALWNRLGLPTRVPVEYSADGLLAAMRRDKKARGGKLRCILPTCVGDARLVDDIDERSVAEIIECCRNDQRG